MNTKALKTLVGIGAGVGTAALLVKVLRRPGVKRALGESLQYGLHQGGPTDGVEHAVDRWRLGRRWWAFAIRCGRKIFMTQACPQVTEENPLPRTPERGRMALSGWHVQ